MEREPLAGLFEDSATGPEIRIGTQGLSPPAWIGSFYPPDIRPGEMVPFYARVFDTVELNTTFYSIPTERTVQSWAKRTPEGFVFAAKFPRIITHELKLLDCEDDVKQFLEAMQLLDDKLGPLLIQLSPDYGKEYLHLLIPFLERLPSEEFDFALEVRNLSLRRKEVFELLDAKRIAWCIGAWRDIPALMKVTADFAYIRLTGTREQVGDEELDQLRIDRTEEIQDWAGDLRERLAPQVTRIYVYINNHYSGHAPATCNQLKQALGVPWVEPLNIWPFRHEQRPLEIDAEEQDQQ